jgi:transcription antitermination factor NusG
MELAQFHSAFRWFAAYTCSRREKQVARELSRRAVEYFLPLYRATRRRNHASRAVDLALFPGYVFVHIALRDRLNVLQIPGVVRLVGFNGQPTPLDDNEMDAMRNALGNGLRAEPYPYLKTGRQVEILTGPLQGLRGRVMRKNNRFRVVLSVELLQRSVVVDVDVVDVVGCGYPLSA